MDLQSFVTETLTQIVHGVRDAQGKVEPLGGAVNPHGLVDTSSDRIYARTQQNQARDVRIVEFDLAVTVDESAKTEVGGKGGIAVLSLGARREGERRDTTVSRVCFSVPVMLPHGKG